MKPFPINSLIRHLNIDMMIRHRPSLLHFTSISILLVLEISLQACNFPGYAERFSAPTPTPAIPATPAPFQEALVVFEVQVPEDSPPNEPVYLSVLDEVTGLALNNERHEMESDGENRYSLSLPFRVGSVIKYRYARQGTYLAEEHTTDQSPVRYRLFLVDGPGTVQDVVSAWSDTFYEGPSGRIMGKVTDAENNLPVPGLLIAAGGAQTLSASDGTFILEGLPPGIHNMVAYATDGAYRTFQQGAVVADLSTTPASFQITPTPVVKVTFLVSVPQETLPNIPVRLAGNLSQLGNTFADLSGGVSTLAIRMPILKPLPDGRDRGDPYGIPMDNPFAKEGGRPEIYAFGLRNPWRFSFDVKTGNLWVADVGQYKWEEINVVARGGNYGWRVMEGTHCFHPSTDCHTTTFSMPLYEYSHEKGRCSIIGGYLYRGQAISSLAGTYVYGDFCSGEIFALQNPPRDQPLGEAHMILKTSLHISSFGEDAAGELYVRS